MLPSDIQPRGICVIARHKYAGFGVKRGLFIFRTYGWVTTVSPLEQPQGWASRVWDYLLSLNGIPPRRAASAPVLVHSAIAPDRFAGLQRSLFEEIAA